MAVLCNLRFTGSAWSRTTGLIVFSDILIDSRDNVICNTTAAIRNWFWMFASRYSVRLRRSRQTCILRSCYRGVVLFKVADKLALIKNQCLMIQIESQLLFYRLDWALYCAQTRLEAVLIPRWNNRIFYRACVNWKGRNYCLRRDNFQQLGKQPRRRRYLIV